MEIGQFTKDVRHIAGLKNVGSDFLSRISPDLRGTEYSDVAAFNLVAQKYGKTPSHNEISVLEGHKLECLSPSVVSEAQSECNEVDLIQAGRHPTSVTFQQVPFGDHKLLCETSMSRAVLFFQKG